MCSRCDNKAVAKKWVAWISIVMVVLMFILTNVFMYGKVIGVIESHIKTDPTYQQLTEDFVTKDEFKTIKDMILYLYKQEGGR